jgi:uncharacterized protein (TIGR02118 family)
MYKVILLIKRKPGMSVEEFQHYWQHEHGTLVAKCPEVRRYVQSCALPQGYRKGELLFDGMGELCFDSAEAFSAYRKNPASAAVAADADNFVDPSRTVMMVVDVHVMKDGAIPTDGVKSIEFVNQREGMPLEAFSSYWRTVHGPLATHISAIRRYEQNHVQARAYENGKKPAYDGLAVTWFDSTEDMKKTEATPEYAATRTDEPNFLREGHLPFIITREHVVVG